MPPIKVETTVKDGEVTLKDGGVVAIRDGATVGVDGAVKVADGGTVKVDGGTVELAPGGTVEVVGTVAQPGPAYKLPDIPAPKSAPDGDKIKREVVVYNQVPHAHGEVHTGWRFPNGGAKTPTSEFCYFSVDHNNGSGERIDLGDDGKFDSRATKLMKSAREAFGKCVWFKGQV
jgi:hypothetical protein